MKGLFSSMILMLLVAATPSLYARVIPKDEGSSFNVVNYGAKGDGQTDDSPAFEKAWQNVCGATQGTRTLLIPKEKSFMLQPVSFKGPCKSGTINIELEGTLIAPKSVDAWKMSNKETWLQFYHINELVIQGGGTIDGQGASWWTSSNRPTALQFVKCKNLALRSVTHINSPRNHISITSCSDSTISKIHIIAPEQSPNTDGIDISSSSNILIHNSRIQTGDDCIAINKGSSFINITGITCGPGHGISVGSLGRDGQHETVEEIYVKNCTFQGTMYGARIKTWKGGSGYARKIRFEDIVVIGAKNPLIIDQNYKDFEDNMNMKDLQAAVQISDVTYHNFTGTSASEAAITLNCDSSVACTNIKLNEINITSAVAGKTTYASCNNVRGTFTSCIPPVHCL